MKHIATCPECGRDFAVKAYRLRLSYKPCCSYSCSYKSTHRKERISEAQTKSWNGPRKGWKHTDEVTSAAALKRSITREEIFEIFKSKSKPTLNGCVEWTGLRRDSGYGKVSYQGRLHLAHRLWWALNGLGDIEGKLLCHKCDNPACINPDHLFPGTQKDNMADAARKGRTSSGESRHNAKLNSGDVSSIRYEYAMGGCSQRSLAVKYGVSQTCISWVVRGKNWKEIALTRK